MTTPSTRQRHDRPEGLTGRVALVTGGSRGIGAAIAEALARVGARVAINYYCRAEAADAVQRRIEDQGGMATTVQADVGQIADIEHLFDAVEHTLGPVDILVNNAGVEQRTPTLAITEENYDWILNTNLKGAFFCAQRALRGMQERGWGRIINISSVHEQAPTGYCSPYGISKGGLFMMMRELAVEFSRYGITVNNIAPGAIETDINRDVLADPAYKQRVIEKTPARMIGVPEDVAHAVVYLASDAARFVTGASLVIDGGLGL